MFWDDQHDVGHVPPKTTWDISGMTIEVIKDETQHMRDLHKMKQLSDRGVGKKNSFRSLAELTGGGDGGGMFGALRRRLFKKADSELPAADVEAPVTTTPPMHEESDGDDSDLDIDGELDDDVHSDSDTEDEAQFHPWEWTIVLAHLHRTEHGAEVGEDPMKVSLQAWGGGSCRERNSRGATGTPPVPLSLCPLGLGPTHFRHTCFPLLAPINPPPPPTHTARNPRPGGPLRPRRL